ncbi:hypothetical protein B7W89_07680 [Agrobacterium tumefaciens]|uniref:hypothetical protein n=1 Tax=Agrobacterium tumefaciens TaxID=358 RepID=UPI000B402386|nr:hypothetical protein [Agrobacterium tumefaciens]NSY01180.1 hypothetical protein [Agrobacterium tumefaciens]OVE92247.1 hypothetical protein B7W89_07680 [Agrobacterium tumefaciens]
MKTAKVNVVLSATTGRPVESIGQMIRDAKPIVEARKNAEAKAMKIQTSRIGKRQSKGDGWNGAANDNVSMPAIRWLLTQKKDEMLKPLLAYIRLDREANSGAELIGNTYTTQDLLQVDQNTWIDPKTGELKYKGERRLTGIDFTGREHAGKSKADPMQIKKAPASVPKPFMGDKPVIERMDAKPKLERLRTALGPLLEPFEELALYGKKLEAVGWTAGASNERAAMSIGGSILLMGLSCVAGELMAMRRQERIAA